LRGVCAQTPNPHAPQSASMRCLLRLRTLGPTSPAIVRTLLSPHPHAPLSGGVRAVVLPCLDERASQMAPAALLDQVRRGYGGSGPGIVIGEYDCLRGRSWAKPTITAAESLDRRYRAACRLSVPKLAIYRNAVPATPGGRSPSAMRRALGEGIRG